ncbi:MAG: PGF-CTERM sorting domain-containing protein [Halobacteriaceae archaeon]
MTDVSVGVRTADETGDVVVPTTVDPGRQTTATGSDPGTVTAVASTSAETPASDDTTTANGDGGTIHGFRASVALVALLAAALVGRRRWR